MIIPLVLLTLFLGYLDELRDYYEVYPALLLLIAYSVVKIFSVDISIVAQSVIPGTGKSVGL